VWAAGSTADPGSRRGNVLPGFDQMTKVIVAVYRIFMSTMHHVYKLSLLLILLCFQLRVPVHYRGVNSPQEATSWFSVRIRNFELRANTLTLSESRRVANAANNYWRPFTTVKVSLLSSSLD
jgi:hypothetical protein